MKTIQRSKTRQHFIFFRNFIKNPTTMASVTPSSASAAKAMFKDIDFSKIDTLVELGPGFGEFTREYLKNIKPETKVILFEIEEHYVDELRKEFGSRVTVIHESAHLMNDYLEHHGIEKVDLIVSGLPFSIGPIHSEIKNAIKKHTEKGCLLRFFTYMPNVMKRYYRDLPIKKLRYEFRNLPPMWIFGIN